MNGFLPGFNGFRGLGPQDDQKTELLTRQRELRKILAFAGWSIDDVIDNPIARNEVRHWYKVGRWMSRELEIAALEKQWNPLR
jgi:hypothetical protein